MRLLLDTQVWLWMQAAPQRLNPEATQLLQDPAVDLLFSAASSWEIAIKYALGKLPLPESPSDYVPARIRSSGVSPLPVTHTHALRVAGLPAHHRDPFDRLLVAQTQLDDLVLLTADAMLERYDISIRRAN